MSANTFHSVNCSKANFKASPAQIQALEQSADARRSKGFLAAQRANVVEEARDAHTQWVFQHDLEVELCGLTPRSCSRKTNAKIHDVERKKLMMLLHEAVRHQTQLHGKFESNSACQVHGSDFIVDIRNPVVMATLANDIFLLMEDDHLRLYSHAKKELQKIPLWE